MQHSRLGCFSATGLIIAGAALLVVVGVAYAGGNSIFSPGKLNAKAGSLRGGVTSHAAISQCAACHTPPFSATHMADRCAECHTEVMAEMGNPAELHGVMLAATGDVDCISCHTDHHGPNASMTSISMADFPHARLGFSLASHGTRADGESFVCADCHPQAYVTYTCEDCHRAEDAAFVEKHIAEFGKDCVACHDGVESFGRDFDHALTLFPLAGRHLAALCVDCHQDARALPALKSTPTDCVSCHLKDEPHGGRFGTDCASCHTTDAWAPAKFDHDLARFKLTGGHVDVACASCHKHGLLAGTPMDCASCHMDKDPHGDVFSTGCAACHSPNSWDDVSYDHSQTGFILDGAHINVACQDCHDSTPASQMSSTCGSCHAKDDAHRGQFGSNCGTCHTTTAWLPSTFDHSTSAVPLTGAHTSAACTSCHANGQFAGTPTSCGACHAKDDHHGGAFGTNCGACHSTTAWRPATFDHSLSRFPLTGAHASVACTTCHPNGQFSGTSSACVSCHAEPAYHRGIFGTKCGSCHNTSNWSARYSGPHPNSCDGPCLHHQGASCRDCHTRTLANATCTKCHDSNNPGEGGGGGGGGD